MASPKPLHIGWASTSITADKPVQLHGQFHERVSTHVNDTCFATACAISTADGSGGDQAIIISSDIVNIGHEQVVAVRERVAAAVPDFDSRKLWMCATHTHTAATMIEGVYPEPKEGVMGPAEYTAIFVERTAQVAIEAWQSRKPAAISRAVGHAAVGFNRRLVYADGHAQMYGNSAVDDFVAVEAGHDHGLELLFTWDTNGNLTGVLVNIACPSQVVEGHCFVSADFWTPAREGIRAKLGADVFVLPMCSAAGDQSPRDLVRRGRGEPNMRNIEGMNEMGRRIAVAVDDAFHHAQSERQGEVVFAHEASDIDLPKRKATAEEVDAARKMLADLTKDANPDPASRDGRLVRRQQDVITRFEEQGDDPRHTADVHIMRLGDVAFATNPFELYLEYGLRMKARSKAAQTFVVQLTNGRGIYLPTRHAVAGGHYGAMIYDNNVGPDGGDELVEHAVGTINGMFE